MDPAQDLEVIHLLLSPEDRRELEACLESQCPGLERIATAPRAVALDLCEKFSKRAKLRDLQVLIDVKHLTG